MNSWKKISENSKAGAVSIIALLLSLFFASGSYASTKEPLSEQAILCSVSSSMDANPLVSATAGVPAVSCILKNSFRSNLSNSNSDALTINAGSALLHNSAVQARNSSYGSSFSIRLHLLLRVLLI
jgi:hypothetical protein